MRIEIRNLDAKEWTWELRDSFGHSVCICLPRNGLRYYRSKASCIKSVERFEEMVLGRGMHFDVVMLVNGEFAPLW